MGYLYYTIVVGVCLGLEFYGLSILYYTIVVGVCFRARILWAIYTIVVGAHWDQLNYTIIIGLKFYGL